MSRLQAHELFLGLVTSFWVATFRERGRGRTTLMFLKCSFSTMFLQLLFLGDHTAVTEVWLLNCGYLTAWSWHTVNLDCMCVIINYVSAHTHNPNATVPAWHTSFRKPSLFQFSEFNELKCYFRPLTYISIFCELTIFMLIF